MPDRFGLGGGTVDLDTYFALARGTTRATGSGTAAVAPLEMTKWFDTNYHYLVPELGPGTTFSLASTKPVDEFTEALGLGIETRPVLIGPVTYLLLAKPTVPGFSTLELLPALLDVYGRGPRRAGRGRGLAGSSSTNRCLGTDLDDAARRGLSTRPTARSPAGRSRCWWPPTSAISATTWSWPPACPVAGLHVDLVRHPGPAGRRLSTAWTTTPCSRPVWSTAATSGATTSAGPSTC